MSDKIDVSLCFPVHNESEALRTTIVEAKQAMDALPYSYEIIIVDDGSTDNCTDQIKDLGVRIVRHRKNYGGGVARVTALKFARGKIVLQSDADNTYPASCFKEVLEKAQKADLVIGSRRRESATDWTFLRVTMKWILKTFASFLSGHHIPDLNSGLRAYDKDLVLRYEYLYPKGHSIMSTMTLAFLTEGYRVEFVDIDYRVRVGKSSFRPFQDTFNYLVTIIRTIAVYDPLRIFVPVALVLFFAGVLFALRNFAVHFELGHLPPLLIISGMLTFISGILSDQLSKLSRQVAKLTNKGLVRDEDVEEITFSQPTKIAHSENGIAGSPRASGI